LFLWFTEGCVRAHSPWQANHERYFREQIHEDFQDIR